MLLLIACGNSLRQDDGAGLILAERVAEAWRVRGLDVRYLPVHQLLPELAVEIAAPAVRQVWFVDCRIASNEADTAVQMTPIDTGEREDSGWLPALGHHITPELLLQWARQLFDDRPVQMQPAAWQITVPGFQFDHAETLSDACQAVLDSALEQILWQMGTIIPHA